MSDQLSLAPFAPTGTSPAVPTRPLRVIGIDLGTTNSTIAEVNWRPGDTLVRARCLDVDQRTGEGLYTHVLVPSIVALQAQSTLVGEGAKRLRSRSGELGLRQNRNLFFDCKNDIGLRRTYHLAPEGFRSPLDIATRVLKFLQDAALADDPTAPSRVVVTVPASFQAAQRRDTLEAARQAGLKLEAGDLLDEPVAAFLDFLVSQQSSAFEGVSGARKLLVFDFGGGTCDVAVLEVHFGGTRQSPTISPLAVSRYHRLGGGDIDAAIVHEVLVRQVIEQNGLSPFELSFDDKKNFLEPALLSVAEALKIGLCSEIRRLESFQRYAAADKTAVVKVQPGLHRFRVSSRELILQSPRLTAAEFESLLTPFLDADLLYAVEGEYRVSCSIFAPITDAIDRSRLRAEDIDFCLLVGGSSLIPQVPSAVGAQFSKANVLTYRDAVDAQTAVAKGAAYHALSLSAFGRGVFTPAAHDDIALRTSSGLIPLIRRGALLPFGKGATERFELAVPETTILEPCRLRVELIAGSGDKERALFCGVWDIVGPVTRGDALSLQCSLDENHVLSLELRLAGVDETKPFRLTIENPLTHVSNPLRSRLRIDEREEALRNREVPAEQIPAELVELADGYRELNHHEKALEYLRRALMAEGRPDPNILNRMGIICGDLGDADRQEKLYLEAAAASSWSGPLFNLALAHFLRGNHVKAQEAITKALARLKSAPYLVLAGRIAAAQSRVMERERLFTEARRTFPQPEAMDAFTLDWAAALGRDLPDEAFLQACDKERRRRKAGFTATEGTQHGVLPDVRGGLVATSL